MILTLSRLVYASAFFPPWVHKEEAELDQAHVDVSTTDIHMLPHFLHAYWIHKEEAQPDQVHADVKLK